MNPMFKDWNFWRPILLFVGITAGYFALLHFLPAKAGLVLALSIALSGFLWILYNIGKATYEMKKLKMDDNYRKITGEDSDA